MVDLRNPLRHAHVVRVFRLKQEFEARVCKAHFVATNPSIGAQPCKNWIPFSYQPQPSLFIDSSGICWRLIDSLDEIVVQIRRANRDLRLFQSKHSIVVPRGLPKSDKSNGVPATSRTISLFGLSNQPGNLRLKQAGNRFLSLEHDRVQ